MSNKLYSFFVKRILDLIFGGLLFVIILIPMIVISVCIIIMDGTPVIFKQIRVGKNGKKFYIYKFRTMVNDAEKIGPQSTSANDSRITKIGNVLRRTSLDELPQIVNVIKGDMSFVGYRPDVFRENNDYNTLKYELKPGITGYAQVNGRSNLNLEQVRYWEEKYNNDISFVTDLKILFKTFTSVLTKGGAN